ncbi:NYN domain-containing protein [Patescibacteria group bacterium]|nr:NYN domain-containing protein [Patescibacteria group bacterium]
MRGKERLIKVLKRFFRKKEEVIPEKVVILTDGENLYFSLRELGGLEISDFEEFKKRLARGKELARPPIYYRSVDITKPKYPEETLKTLKFLSHLKEKGFEIKKRPLLKGQRPQSEIDPWISDGIYRCAIDDNISTIILVSGDHHFLPALLFAKEKGKKVKVVSTAASLSAELKKVSDEWIDLEKITKGITKKPEIEEKREQALGKLEKGEKINLSDLKATP